MSHSRIRPYIKYTERKHSSGYNVIECGYIDAGEGDSPTRKYIVSGSTDHVSIDASIDGVTPRVNIDLTTNGYFRLWSHDGDLVWANEGFPMSSMSLTLGSTNITEDMLMEIK